MRAQLPLLSEVGESTKVRARTVGSRCKQHRSDALSAGPFVTIPTSCSQAGPPAVSNLPALLSERRTLQMRPQCTLVKHTATFNGKFSSSTFYAIPIYRTHPPPSPLGPRRAIEPLSHQCIETWKPT